MGCYPEQSLNQIKPFSILFYKASFRQSKIGWFIRKVTGDEVNHVGWYLGKWRGFRLCYESDDKGPSVNEFNSRYLPTYAGYFRKPLTSEEKKKLLIEFRKLKDRKYDWIRLLGFHLGLNSAKRILCTELVIEPLRAIGRDIRRDNDKPQGLFESPDLVIYRIVSDGVRVGQEL